MGEQLVDCVLSQRVLHVVLLGRTVPITVELVQFYGNVTQLFAVEAFVYLTEPTLPQKTQQLVLSDSRPNAVSSCFQSAVPRMLLLIKQPILFYMQGLLFLQTFEHLLAIIFLPAQKESLTGQGRLHIFGFLNVLALSSLAFAALQCILFLLDILQFLPNLPKIRAVHPLLLPLLVGKVLAQSDLIVADPLPQLISFTAVQLDCRLYYLCLEFRGLLLPLPQLLFQNLYLLPNGLLPLAVLWRKRRTGGRCCRRLRHRWPQERRKRLRLCLRLRVVAVLRLKIVSNLPVQLHLLLRQLDIRVEGTVLMRLLGQLVQLRHDLLRIRALDTLERLLTHLRPQLTRPSHPVLKHADALQLLRLHRAKILQGIHTTRV